ncbi:MAG: lytic transglycosylase domain-containing protein [Nitrospirota bacterium]
MFYPKVVDPNHKTFYTQEVKFSVRYKEIIQKWARYYNIDPVIVQKIIKIESNYQPLLVSKAGAIGLMQVMPEEFKDANVKKEDRFKPYYNIYAGVRAFRRYYEQIKKETNVRDPKKLVYLTLAAYNGGQNGIVKAIKKYGEDRAISYRPIETINYVARYKRLPAKHKINLLPIGIITLSGITFKWIKESEV